MNEPKETKMVAGQKPTTKMVKIQALRDIRIDRPGPDGKTQHLNVKRGEVVEVTESEAKEFCDKIFKAHYAFSGERYETDGEVRKHHIVRAKRLV